VLVSDRVTAAASVAASDATIRWQTPLENELTRPTLDADRVYLGQDDGHLVALDRSTGQESWRFERPDSYYTGDPLAVAHDRVYAPNLDSSLYVVDSTTGDFHWKFRTDDRLTGMVDIDTDRVYVLDTSATVYALST
jgi:outer membrane protein assembly factor BamB